jgi:hypothetical protein
MTETLEPGTSAGANGNNTSALSLGTAAARNLATTTKTQPQMQGISSRWLPWVLPWVQISGGTYRVNRRLTHVMGGGRVAFTNVGAHVQLIPETLGELPLYRGFEDIDVFRALADRLEQQEYGLRHAGLPDEYQPGLSVRFMGINEKAIISYLVSTYYSVAVLVPDALGVLEDVELGS